MTYNIFQPKAGIISDAKTAARIAPICPPIATIDVAFPNFSLGVDSETKDMQAPYSPPAPIPAINLNK